MFKKNVAIVIMLLFAVSAFPQTWREVAPTDDTIVYEYTVITEEEFSRLLRLNETRSKFAYLEYQDMLEMGEAKIISGHRPNLRGYYYLIGKIFSTDSEVQDVFILASLTNILVYGNSNTGVMNISYINEFGALALSFALQDVLTVGDSAYRDKFNQYAEFVNGK